jgi:hypothetical protein
MCKDRTLMCSAQGLKPAAEKVVERRARLQPSRKCDMRDAALAAEVRFFKTRRPEPPRFWQPKQL